MREIKQKTWHIGKGRIAPVTCKLKWTLLCRPLCEVLASLLSVLLPVVTITATGGHLQTDHRSDSNIINEKIYPVF